MARQEIPVYMFTGFLESGKTTFIQDAMEGREFNSGESTLLLLCEEGIEEYDRSRFASPNVHIYEVEDTSDLNPKKLANLVKKYDAERVVVEYNGMWMLQELFMNMPQEWTIYQEVTFMDATTFLNYNQNMRQLMFDKLQTAELVVFNRCVRGEFDKEEFHKIVRVANRKSQIIYEYGPDDAEPDTIVDPLPFNLDDPIVKIDDDAYAEWYRDINDEQDKYEGKTIEVKGRVALGGGLADDEFVFGRHVMTCCVEDIQFAGLLYKFDGAKDLTHGGWVKLIGTVKNEASPIYEGDVGPIVYCESVTPCDAAEPEVATF